MLDELLRLKMYFGPGAALQNVIFFLNQGFSVETKDHFNLPAYVNDKMNK